MLSILFNLFTFGFVVTILTWVAEVTPFYLPIISISGILVIIVNSAIQLILEGKISGKEYLKLTKMVVRIFLQ